MCTYSLDPARGKHEARFQALQEGGRSSGVSKLNLGDTAKVVESRTVAPSAPSFPQSALLDAISGISPTATTSKLTQTSGFQVLTNSRSGLPAFSCLASIVITHLVCSGVVSAALSGCLSLRRSLPFWIFSLFTPLPLEHRCFLFDIPLANLPHPRD